MNDTDGNVVVGSGVGDNVVGDGETTTPPPPVDWLFPPPPPTPPDANRTTIMTTSNTMTNRIRPPKM